MTEFGGHQASVRNGIESHRVLCQAIEELPAMTGSSSVEPEGELIEVVIEMLTRHTSLVDAQEPPFQQCGDSMDTGQQGRSGLATPAHHAGSMAIAVADQARVSGPAIRDHHRTRSHGALHEADQTLPRGVRDPFEPDPPRASTPDFRRDGDQRLGLAQVPLALAGLDAPDEDFIHLDFLRQRLPTWADHRPPQLVQDCPCRLVATQPQGTLESQGAHPALLVRHQPDRLEPHPQGQLSAMEDRSRCHRHVMATGAALPEFPARGPGLAMAAARTAKPLGPPQLTQIHPASVLGAEAVLELQHSAGVIFIHGISLRPRVT